MNILKPDLVWIENRCYRKIPVRDSELKPYVEEYSRNQISENLEDIDEYEDLMMNYERNLFWISISVAQPLIKHVCGSHGKTKNMIEQSTNTSIKIPPPNKDGDIIITGDTKNSVGEAYRRIEDIAKHSRWKIDFTHFISIPINHSNIVEAYVKFKEDVLSTCKSVRGIDKSIFQEPKKLHLTIAILVLLNDKDKKNAEIILKKCSDKILNILGDKTLHINVKGIEYMNDDPGEVDVLYAQIKETDEDNCIQLISDELMKDFVQVSLAKKQHEKVKLHVTLMNTSFRKKDENPEKITFDARPLLQKYNDYDFGKMHVKEIHISTRYSTGSDGYFIANHKISLP